MSESESGSHRKREEGNGTDTLRIERDVLLDEQEGRFIYGDCPH